MLHANNFLIIPDVHGRDFWRTPVMEWLNKEDVHIIFLGDYHDPYPHEWERKNESQTKKSLEGFKEIVELKKQNPDKITLLLGNHDCGYAINENVCSCRMDERNRKELCDIFNDNRDLFKIAEECNVADKHFVFSHAGILKGWVKDVWHEDEIDNPEFNVINELNDAWKNERYVILNSLGMYDGYRGWGGGSFGSPVWSDIRSWAHITPDETYGYNVVGHTMTSGNPIFLDTIVDLDCQCAFVLDSEGKIKNYK